MAQFIRQDITLEVDDAIFYSVICGECKDALRRSRPVYYALYNDEIVGQRIYSTWWLSILSMIRQDSRPVRHTSATSRCASTSHLLLVTMECVLKITRVSMELIGAELRLCSSRRLG